MSESKDAERLPRMLRALAGDAENTDGWEGATGDLRDSADLIERQSAIIEALVELFVDTTTVSNPEQERVVIEARALTKQ